MIGRIQQFARAIVAKSPSKAEQEMLSDILSVEAQRLFLAMSVADQRHSLRVWETAQSLLDDREDPGMKPLNQQQIGLLQRCSLLHDIGRGSAMGPIRKSFGVLLHKFCPLWGQGQTGANQGYFAQIAYRYYQHPCIGSEMLRSLGMTEEAAIIKLHHSVGPNQLSQEQKQVLTLLQQADSMN